MMLIHKVDIYMQCNAIGSRRDLRCTSYLRTGTSFAQVQTRIVGKADRCDGAVRAFRIMFVFSWNYGLKLYLCAVEGGKSSNAFIALDLPLSTR